LIDGKIFTTAEATKKFFQVREEIVVSSRARSFLVNLVQETLWLQQFGVASSLSA
jgi:hypothetical protein